ncbi:MAG: hypothetical protein BWY15_00286 [Firmicutes bacterium ADurb.Bin193]|nr:MAG: hypothetical protein BWY15_00286 [Firmicutes bacterium ADurb.Bin193]
MKKKIYTIPINEAFDEKCGCPFCLLEKRLEDDAVEYTLGAAMMEPDFRIKTNERGFCKRHFSVLQAQNNALALALIMKSQSETQIEKINKASNTQKTGLFKKPSAKAAAKSCADMISCFVSSCAICDRVNNTMGHFFENTVYLWKSEKDFKAKFGEAVFCLPHFAKLLKYAAKGLGEKDLSGFYKKLLSMQNSILNKCDKDILNFTKLFDHRSEKNPSPETRAALKQIIKIYSGE